MLHVLRPLVARCTPSTIAGSRPTACHGNTQEAALEGPGSMTVKLSAEHCRRCRSGGGGCCCCDSATACHSMPRAWRSSERSRCMQPLSGAWTVLPTEALRTRPLVKGSRLTNRLDSPFTSREIYFETKRSREWVLKTERKSSSEVAHNATPSRLEANTRSDQTWTVFSDVKPVSNQVSAIPKLTSRRESPGTRILLTLTSSTQKNIFQVSFVNFEN